MNNPVMKYITAAASNLKHADALPTQKVCAVALSTLFAPSFLPIYLYNDANRVYLTYTNGDFKKFGYEKQDTSIIQILFE